MKTICSGPARTRAPPPFVTAACLLYSDSPHKRERAGENGRWRKAPRRSAPKTVTKVGPAFLPGGAGNRRFRLLSALRAHTKVP